VTPGVSFNAFSSGRRIAGLSEAAARPAHRADPPALGSERQSHALQQSFRGNGM
jgi:hypothetical protein